MNNESEIPAPFPGIFYRRPDPDSPPYVEVGDDIHGDTVIGLIEVMKMFQEVPAGVAGRLSSFAVEDGDAVNSAQTLATVVGD